ncbi:MAG: diphthine--ammonia ligase [Thermoplasmata archaeon]|nr:diphthine--ammonia ligase [Thermoplasmata archaeon]
MAGGGGDPLTDGPRVTALVSGGKDSIYAAYLAESQAWPVDELLVLRPSDPESMMFHTPNLHLVSLQAEAWGKPCRYVEFDGRGEAAETKALTDALATGGDRIVAGAIASSYQWGRLNRIAHGLGRKVYTPLWGKEAGRVVREEIAAGLDIRLVHLAAEPLGADLAGQRLDLELLAELERRSAERRPIHVGGEGGEYETLVVDAPFFARRIEIDDSEVKRDGRATTFIVRAAHLAEKVGRSRAAS